MPGFQPWAHPAPMSLWSNDVAEMSVPHPSHLMVEFVTQGTSLYFLDLKLDVSFCVCVIT